MSVDGDNGAEMGKKFSQIEPFNRRLPPLGEVYTHIHQHAHLNFDGAFGTTKIIQPPGKMYNNNNNNIIYASTIII